MLMKKIIFLICSILAAGSMLAQSETSPTDLVTTEPAQGVLAEFGTPNLVFGTIPTPNKACTEPAILTYNGETISEIYTYQTAKLQQYTEGQVDESVRIVFVTKKLTDPGVYKVHVPAKYFVFNKLEDSPQYSKELELEYIIPEPTKIISVPAAGFVKSVPAEITVEFPGYVSIIDNKIPPNDDKENSIAFDSYYDVTTYQDGDGNMTIDGNKITFKIGSKPITGAGTYALIFYNGSITLVDAQGNKTDILYTRIAWTIALIPAPVISPAEGDVYEIGDISFTLTDGTFGIFVGLPSLFKDKNGEVGEKITYWNKEKAIVRGDKTANFVMDDGPVTTPGKYIVRLGKSSFSGVGPYYDKEYLGDDEEEEGEDDRDPSDWNGPTPSPLTFAPMYVDEADKIVEAWNNCNYLYYYTIVLSPAQGETRLEDTQTVASLSEMTIYFPGAKEELYDNLNNIADEIQLLNRLGKPQSGYEFKVTVDDLSEVKSATISIEPPVTKSGLCTLKVPAGAFVCDDLDSRMLMQIFNVDPSYTGVAVVDAYQLPSNPDVYSIDGRLVLKGASAEQLENLPKGLYIANGVKFLKK